jgi:hypothetical protein
MRTSLVWIQPHPHRAIQRHILNTVTSFQITLSIDFENILLPKDLTIVRNHRDEEDVGESFRGVEGQQGHPIKVGDQSNSEFQSLALIPTRSSGPPCIKIDAQDATTSDLDILHMHGKSAS